MFAQNDDSQQRVVLFFIFGLVALVVVSVIGFAVHKRGSVTKAASTPELTIIATQPVLTQDGPPSGAQAASDAASVKVEQGIVKFYFASGKADLAAGASDALTDVVKGAQAGHKLLISGFHDATGDAVQNAELAKQRSLAVRDALNAAGVPQTQIELKKPEQVTGSGSDAEARRVEISLEQAQ